MCGRFTITDPREQQLRFGFVDFHETRPLPAMPRFNVAPAQTVPVVVEDPEARHLRAMTWGFRPAWMGDAGKRPPPINARAETLLERPLFRTAVPRHRCLIPATGFYEWAAVSGRKAKQPWYFKLQDGAPFGFAGLWTAGEDGAGSFVLLTTAPNDLVAPIHDRMPVILAPDDEASWLDPEVADPLDVLGCLGPYPAELMTGYPVSTAVNAVGNDGPELVRPLRETADPA